MFVRSAMIKIRALINDFNSFGRIDIMPKHGNKHYSYITPLRPQEKQPKQKADFFTSFSHVA
jgi:hypothetical protein